MKDDPDLHPVSDEFMTDLVHIFILICLVPCLVIGAAILLLKRDWVAQKILGGLSSVRLGSCI